MLRVRQFICKWLMNVTRWILVNAVGLLLVQKSQQKDFIIKFSQAIKDGFQLKGYKLVKDRSETNAKLLINLRTLRFTSWQTKQEGRNTAEEGADFTFGEVKTKVTIVADVRQGNANYRREYKASKIKETISVSLAEKIDAQLSQVLDGAVARLFNDKKLDDFLTNR